MENILYALLTEKSARKPENVENLGLKQQAMQPWAEEPPL